MSTGSSEIVVPTPKGEPPLAASLYKILIIGDSSVGKTSLLNRYCDDSFQGVLIATVGIDYKTKYLMIADETVKMQIWDTAGQERFRTLTNAYFRGACGAVLLYDITSRDSFTSVVGWMESVEEHANSDICIAIVGHKVDLEEERVISTEEGRKLAENYDSLFFEASAKSGINCSKIFAELAAKIKEMRDSKSCAVDITSQSRHLDSGADNGHKQSSCC